jgi:nitrite reductase/ring-hydroxylating ferredoxin subunit
MAYTDTPPPGPDFAQGVPLTSIPAIGVLAGHVDGTAVLLARLEDGIHAVSGTCTHYGAPLAEGLVVDGEIRCPWHHACFSLRTGAALRAPAFAALATWKTDIVGDRVFVRGEDTAPHPAPPRPRIHPERIVIIGGGGAGYAAATRLRELGYDGALTMLSADDAVPCDRPNLSKDYLAGTAPEDWIPLQGAEYYVERRIDLRLDCEVAAIETDARHVRTKSGERFGYDALLIVGAGVAPRTALAAAAGMEVDNGILVDSRLQTSIPGHYAAGDAARYRHGEALVRVEHWVHAQRQGQAAASNMLGAAETFADVPFFWTHQFDLELRFTGNAQGWDAVEIDGDLAARDFTARYRRDGQLVAAASVGRDLENLAIEAELHG